MAKDVAGRAKPPRASENRRIQKERVINMQQANLKILRDFYKYPDSELVTFAYNVAANLDPTKFVNLTVSPKDLEALTDDFSTKLAATITGGTVETAAKNKAGDALKTALNDDANIVELVVKTNLELLLSTGYLPASTNRTSSPLADTSITSLANNGTTQVLVRLAPVVNAKSYQVQVSPDGGKTWLEGAISPQARRIVLMNLVPGTTYAVRARAIGGSTGASNWCGSMAIMST
jgi:hypothetical protein